MKTCQCCGKQTDEPTCPNCGEASWTEEAPQPEPPKKSSKK